MRLPRPPSVFPHGTSGRCRTRLGAALEHAESVPHAADHLSFIGAAIWPREDARGSWGRSSQSRLCGKYGHQERSKRGRSSPGDAETTDGLLFQGARLSTPEPQALLPSLHSPASSPRAGTEQETKAGMNDREGQSHRAPGSRKDMVQGAPKPGLANLDSVTRLKGD